MATLAALRLPDHVCAADEPAALEAINRPGINLALWRRSLPAGLRALVADPRWERGLAFRETIELADCRRALETALGEIGFSRDEPGAVNFLDDAVALAARFATLAGAQTGQVALETVCNGMCTAFHTDFNRLRLITTYRGPGTLWTENINVRRNFRECKTDDRLLDPTLIHSFATGDVGILKGEKHPDKTQAIVHRSPDPEPNGLRILFRVDW